MCENIRVPPWDSCILIPGWKPVSNENKVSCSKDIGSISKFCDLIVRVVLNDAGMPTSKFPE